MFEKHFFQPPKIEIYFKIHCIRGEMVGVADACYFCLEGLGPVLRKISEPYIPPLS